MNILNVFKSFRNNTKNTENKENPKKKISIIRILIIITVLFFLLTVAVISSSIFGEKSYKEIKTKKSNSVVNQAKKVNKVSKQIKLSKKAEIIENPYDVFKNFYIEKYQSEISKKITEKYIKQLQACYKEKKQLQEKFQKSFQKPKILKDIIKPAVKVKVKAIYCIDTCYAITNLGLLKNGQKIKDRKVIITKEGVRFK